MREVSAGEWGPFLERFGREHRAWLATVHVVDAGSTVHRSAVVPMKSASASADVVKLEFLGDTQPVCLHRPCALRIQQTDIGRVHALEIETAHGQFIRLAFRATPLPEQLDGLAPGELSVDPSTCTEKPSNTLANLAARRSRRRVPVEGLTPHVDAGARNVKPH